ncbi:hypothetical protein [Bradyrhizobium sp. USDA 3397]
MRLLETTLRDGSYAINFQFTARDTAVIAGQLEAAGFELIEIGHGVGLGASQRHCHRAAETDEAYLSRRRRHVEARQVGYVLHPRVATLGQIDMAADYGMKFIRIGTDVADVPDSKEYRPDGCRSLRSPSTDRPGCSDNPPSLLTPQGGAGEDDHRDPGGRDIRRGFRQKDNIFRNDRHQEGLVSGSRIQSALRPVWSS